MFQAEVGRVEAAAGAAIITEQLKESPPVRAGSEEVPGSSDSSPLCRGSRSPRVLVEHRNQRRLATRPRLVSPAPRDPLKLALRLQPQLVDVRNLKRLKVLPPGTPRASQQVA